MVWRRAELVNILQDIYTIRFIHTLQNQIYTRGVASNHLRHLDVATVYLSPVPKNKVNYRPKLVKYQTGQMWQPRQQT